MHKFPWSTYAGKSVDELLDLATTDRVELLVIAIDIAIGQKAAKLGDDSLSVPERDVLAIKALEAEVNNGGYSQFFTNYSKRYAAEIVSALQRVGCPEIMAITEQAIAALPRGAALSTESLDAEMARPDAERDARLDACDQSYYASRENIAAALIQYLERHRSRLRLP